TKDVDQLSPIDLSIVLLAYSQRAGKQGRSFAFYIIFWMTLFRIVGLVLPIKFDAAGDAVIFARENVVFAERKTFPVISAQNAPQIRVARKTDYKKVVRFALMPIGGGPEVNDRGDARLVARRINFYCKRMP